MTSLVTGATGFAGGHLARALLARGERVRILARPTSDAGPLADAGAEVVTGLLQNPADVLRAAEGVTRIFHFAGVFRTAGHPDSYYHDVNVGGVENILAAAQRHGVARTVHVSTIGIHGDVREIPCTEETPANPGDIYQRTKLEGERAALAAFARGLPGVVVRPASMYGPGDTRLLKLFRTLQRGTFRMFGDGEALFHGVYIDDLVDGVLLAARRDEALGEAVILAGPRYTTLNELVETIAHALGVPPPRAHLPLWPLLAAGAAVEALCRPLGVDPPLHRRRVHFFINNRAFAIDKARRLLGYEPGVDIAEGVARTVQWYRSRGLLKGAGPTEGPTPGRRTESFRRHKGGYHEPGRSEDPAQPPRTAQSARS